MVDESAAIRDLTTQVVGRHPFALRVVYGDERVAAFVSEGSARLSVPGVQVLTPTAAGLVTARHGVSVANLHHAAGVLRTDFPFLLNTACELTAEKFAHRVRTIAGNAGVEISPADQRTLGALKQAVDESGSLGPQAIIRMAVAYLVGPEDNGRSTYGILIDHVNRALLNPTGNPRVRHAYPPIRGVQDIGAGGLQLWWVKEGSATIVFQVRVDLGPERPPVSFVLNVAKDTTTAADELRRAYADFVDFFRMEPRGVMEPFGLGDTSVPTWRGATTGAALAAEWFEGHALHVYEGSSQLYVWLDQRMGSHCPIEPAESDRLWGQVAFRRARYTRRTSEDLVPIATHVNAGDYIACQRDDGEWDMLMIWARRAPASVSPGDYIVLAGMLDGVNVFGADEGRTVWRDRPARSLAAIRAGLAAAGLSDAEFAAMLSNALAGPFTEFADHPERMPHSALVRTADHEELRQVFRRARDEIELFLRRGRLSTPTGPVI